VHFVPTKQMVLFGHSFAAIAGRVSWWAKRSLRSFGVFAVTVWLICRECVLTAAVQDCINTVLLDSGETENHGQMAREEGEVRSKQRSGVIAQTAVLDIG